MIRRFLRAAAGVWRHRHDVHVSVGWLAQQERAEMKDATAWYPWRWPFRREHDMNGPRNSWLLREHGDR